MRVEWAEGSVRLGQRRRRFFGFCHPMSNGLLVENARGKKPPILLHHRKSINRQGPCGANPGAWWLPPGRARFLAKIQMPLYSNFSCPFRRLFPSHDSLVVTNSIHSSFFLAISCPDMVLGRRVRTELSLVNPGFNYLLGLEAILLAARGGKEIRARAQQRSQGYFLLLARGAAAGACVLTRRNPKVAAVNPKVYFRRFRAGKKAARPPRSHGFWVRFCNICRKTMGL